MFSLEFLIKKNVQKKSEKISSFEKINLFITGMRFSREYEIINKGEKTEIVLNFRKYLNGEEKRIPDKKAETETESFVAFLNSIDFGSWNGFSGKHPKNVLDGEMFRMEAKISSENVINAEGSENFPKGYKDFIKELDLLLKGGV